jgi:hypothetical protein
MMLAGGRWAQVDRPRADRWIASLPPAERDRVARGVADFLGRRRPSPGPAD